jgi:hypothetical protein
MTPPLVRPWRPPITPGARRPDLPPWFWTCAAYPSATAARRAWERIERKTRGGGELGLYRHGVPGREGRLVSAVGLDRAAVERAAKLLSDGVDERLPSELVEAMVIRRARVVVEAAAAYPNRTGRIKIRRPESGARLDQRGVMHDEPGGQG